MKGTIGVRKMKKAIVLISIFLSPMVTASDINNFTVRGVKVGESSKLACNKVAADFPLGLLKFVSEKLDRKVYLNNSSGIDKYMNHRKGCSGGFTAFGESDDSLVWSDNIVIKSISRIVYHVKNNQEVIVGDSISECDQRRESYVKALTSKYGAPTYKSRNRSEQKINFRNLEWDYSTSNTAKPNDEEYELYQIRLECKKYFKENPVVLMNIQIELHSGQVIKKAKALAKTKVNKTITPTF